MKPAIFLDRDGVINYNRPDYVKSWAEFEFLPGSLAALHRLSLLSWPIVIITNQSAIGRGLITCEVVNDIHSRMLGMIQSAGGRIDCIFYCPHRPDESCACRKPRPGMLQDAARQLDIDLTSSYMVGDAESDVLVAFAAGSQPILVRSGRGNVYIEKLTENTKQRVLVFDDLNQSVDWIVEQARLRVTHEPA